MRKRKFVTMLVRVSVPVDMTASQARLEVRTLVNEQCNHSADYEDVKVRAIRPVNPRRI